MKIFYGDSRPEKSLSALMLMALWAKRLVSMKPSSISTVTKISVLLAHEVLDGLLLPISTEINDGPFANDLNMVLFPALKKKSSTSDLPSVGWFLHGHHGHWPGT